MNTAFPFRLSHALLVNQGAALDDIRPARSIVCSRTVGELDSQQRYFAIRYSPQLRASVRAAHSFIHSFHCATTSTQSRTNGPEKRQTLLLPPWCHGNFRRFAAQRKREETTGCVGGNALGTEEDSPAGKFVWIAVDLAADGRGGGCWEVGEEGEEQDESEDEMEAVDWRGGHIGGRG